MLDIDISSFIKQQRLPKQYQQLSQQWFSALAENIASHQFGAKKPLVIGINGAQGSGKSTLASLLQFILSTHFKLKTVSMSLDDFYFTRQEREELAVNIHPLLLTRGVPGTHDVALAKATISQLINQQLPVSIPRFNKAIDDRLPESQADQVTEPVDIILLEGWCMGAEAQGTEQLAAPINDLESTEDPDQTWRKYVNLHLAKNYPALFNMVDVWVMLKAPNFDTIFNWRLEQENKLREKAGPQDHVMNAKQVRRFIQFYQRITENTLKTLPEKVHYLFELDKNRQVINMATKPYTEVDTTIKKWLIFTDMDGSLLDHYTYAFEDARPTLEKLQQKNIPVIPITSKTQAELLFLRETLNNNHPFIIENGAAVFIPKGYFDQQPQDTVERDGFWVKEFVTSREHWQSLIAKISANFTDEFITFSQAGVDGVMEMTSLDHDAASRAAQRQYGEPVSWLGSPERKKQFMLDLKGLGANILEGGRFMHVSGISDKGVALEWLAAVYQAQMPSDHITTIALGDSNNDKAMLEVADYAVLIRSPVHAPPAINRDNNLLISKNTGPKGWAEGVHQFIGADLHAD